MEVASLIKKPNKRYMRITEVASYPEYAQLINHIKEHRDVIVNGWKVFAALTIKENDISKLIYHTLIQGRWRDKL